jgi:hypothetical protein
MEEYIHIDCYKGCKDSIKKYLQSGQAPQVKIIGFNENDIIFKNKVLYCVAYIPNKEQPYLLLRKNDNDY